MAAKRTPKVVEPTPTPDDVPTTVQPTTEARPPPAESAEPLGQAIFSILREREALLEQHPVSRWDESFVIQTPPLQETAAFVSSVVMRARHGQGVYATPRFGKTRAMRYLIRALQATPAFAKVPTLWVDASQHSHLSESRFYETLIAATGCTPRKGSANAQLEHLIRLLSSLATIGGDRRMVLFVDEAQTWATDEWGWLKHLQNEVAGRLNLTLLVFLFAQPEIVHMRSALKAAGRRDLTARFLRKLVELRGLGSAEDLEAVMAVFDRSVWPRDRGWAHSQFFFPRAWGTGWRFAQEAKTAWEAIVQATEGTDVFEVGMEPVCLALQHVLLEFMDEDRVGFHGTPELWKEAVDASDLAEMLRDDGDEPGKRK